jgi:DNA-binding GntR family transcriptional regulator
MVMEPFVNSASFEFVNHTLADKIYEVVKKSIIYQEYKQGSRLVDQEIADLLGVSRTPVREAISRLAAEGLVSSIPRHGVFVTELSEKDIREIYEVRESLEVLAIRLAVALMSDEDINGLQDISSRYHDSMLKDDYMACYDLDRQFHDRLVKMSGNSLLADMYKALSGKIQISRWKHCRDRNRTEQSLHEHILILQALQSRDAEQAILRLREHIGTVKVDLLKNASITSP